MITTDYTVEGMTCGHCAQAVTTEIKKIDGVSDVRVTVESGAVQVDSADALAIDTVAAAVDEAGYTLVR
jgi:copper chaperone CopZ